MIATLSGTRAVAWSKKKPRLRPRFRLSMSPMLVWLEFAQICVSAKLVSRFRSSHHCAAHSFSTFGIKGTRAIYDSSAGFGFEVPTQARGHNDRNFKSTVLGARRRRDAASLPVVTRVGLASSRSREGYRTGGSCRRSDHAGRASPRRLARWSASGQCAPSQFIRIAVTLALLLNSAGWGDE